MNISKRQTSSVLQSWSKQGNLNPISVKDAEGIYIYDFDGKRYTDMSSQLVNLNAGHKCKAIIEGIKMQAENYCYISPSYASEPRAELAEMLLAKSPDNMGKVFFTNGGADANENAVKIAKQYTGRNKVFSRYRSYHGSTFGAGNLTGEPRRYPLEPGIPGFVKFFDPYIYRCGLQFDTEEEYTKYFIDRLKEQIIYENPSEVAAIIL
jgi:taurine--2-oxoglutarate transaminase